MATQADVRRIALSFPGAVEASDRFAFSVPNKGKLKGFAWVWMERITPKKPRVTFGATLAEAVVPVQSGARIAGTIDVESDRVNAFSADDEQFLKQCAVTLEPLWSL